MIIELVSEKKYISISGEFLCELGLYFYVSAIVYDTFYKEYRITFPSYNYNKQLKLGGERFFPLINENVIFEVKSDKKLIEELKKECSRLLEEKLHDNDSKRDLIYQVFENGNLRM